MSLTLQVPTQCCSLEHQTLLPSPFTSTSGHCFCFGSVYSFFLELFLHSSPKTYWVPTDLGSSSFSVISFCLFILFMGFSRQAYWSGLQFQSPVDYILPELFTTTRPSWVGLHGMTHSFIELDKTVVHVISFISVLWLWFSFCLPSDKRLMEDSWWERLTVGELVLMVRAILSKSLNQFSVDSRGCVSSLFDLRPNYGRGNEDNDNFLPKVLFTHCCIQCPCPCSRPLSPHASTRESWTLTGKSRSVSCGVTAYFSWVWCTQGFICALQESVSLVLWKFCNQISLASKMKNVAAKFSVGSQILCQIPKLRNLLGSQNFLSVR